MTLRLEVGSLLYQSSIVLSIHLSYSFAHLSFNIKIKDSNFLDRLPSPPHIIFSKSTAIQVISLLKNTVIVLKSVHIIMTLKALKEFTQFCFLDTFYDFSLVKLFLEPLLYLCYMCFFFFFFLMSLHSSL